MKISRAFFAILLSAPLGACVTLNPATYTVSPEIRQSLQAYEGNKMRLAELAGPAKFDAMCRAVGNLQIDGGLTVQQFVQKAFNDELKFAGLLADNGVQLKGTLTRAEFSSSASLVNGYWELAMTLTSSNGKSMAVEARHEFESGFSGLGACNNTSQALAQASQMLIRKTVADPRFATLVR
jgi:hypothetical protein